MALNTNLQPLGLLTSIKTNLDRIPVSKIVVLGLGGFIVALLVGKASLFSAVKAVDVALFDLMVPALQSIPGVVPVCTQLTKMGSMEMNYGMAIGIGFYGAMQRRSYYLPIAVIGSLFAGHVFQAMVHKIVQGSSPEGYAIGGYAGPFFSGGVMRVTLLVGMMATLALPPSKDRAVWSLAVGFGIVEGFTRLALGRHWPVDTLAGLPIGLGLLWLFRQAVDHWRDGWRTRATDN